MDVGIEYYFPNHLSLFEIIHSKSIRIIVPKVFLVISDTTFSFEDHLSTLIFYDHTVVLFGPNTMQSYSFYNLLFDPQKASSQRNRERRNKQQRNVRRKRRTRNSNCKTRTMVAGSLHSASMNASKPFH